jgi:stage II sporulation protein E
MDDGQVLHSSPYVAQIERFADSLKHLSRTFLRLEDKKKGFSDEEIEDMFLDVKEQVCIKCEHCSWCWNENAIQTYQMGYELLSGIENYGNELNTELIRKMESKCLEAHAWIEKVIEAFRGARQNMMWSNRIAQSREGCAVQMDTFAEMLRNSARELEDRMFSDERLERKISMHFKKKGIRVLYTNFFMNRDGKYEIHITARAMQNECVTTKELVRALSEAVGRRFILEGAHSQMLSKEYMTVICMEGPSYYTLQGVARIGKGCNQISGDNFTMLELPGGKQGVALSDGMGSGEKACKESTLVIELLEELLEAGFPEKVAIQMINSTLVMGREEIHFSTIDMSVFDLYTGTCEIIKAGASSTFIKRKNEVEHLSSNSLPIGVMHSIDVDVVQRELQDGDFVVMVTDGILDALPVGEQDLVLETIIQGTDMNNPKEIAHHILEQVLNWNDTPPQDDMTVLVVGIWET